MPKRSGGILLVVLGTSTLIVGLLTLAFGAATLWHNWKNHAIYSRNLDRLKVQADALTRVRPSPMRDLQVGQLHEEYLLYGGMKAEAEQHFMIGLVCSIAGALFALIGMLVGLLGIFRRPVPRPTVLPP